MTKEATQHALYSPSGAERWGPCPGSLPMAEGLPNKSSKYAAEGTAAHTLAEWTLQDDAHNARAYLGRVITVHEEDNTYQFTVDEDMCEYVQDFADEILRRIDEYKLRGDVKAVHLHIEEKVEFSHIVKHPKQFGTVDVLIVVEYKNGDCLLSVEDLKYGQGVEKHAKGNPQLKIYGLAALHEYSTIYNITEVNTAIHMIRKGYISEHMYTADELNNYAKELEYMADRAKQAFKKFKKEGCSDAFQKTYLNPGKVQCKFCTPKGRCPALAAYSLNAIIDDFDNLDEVEGEVVEGVEAAIEVVDSGLLTPEQVNEFMNAADLVEDWISAIRSQVSAFLYAGKDVPEYMLTEGRKGNRYFADMAVAEETLKSMRVKQDEMYKRTLQTPTQMVKLLKDSPRKLKRLEKLIKQDDGKPHVVRKDSGKKPLEIAPVVDDFDIIEDDTFEDLA